MDGAREILSLTAGAIHIEQQIRALEDAVANTPGLAFDLARALVESVCKTILRDRGYGIPDGEKLPKLFGATIEQLRVLPDAHTADKEAGRAIRQTTGGLHTVVQGICELRRTQGIASHGKVAETRSLESIQAELVARSADAVVSFLYKAHRSYVVQPPKPKRIELGDNHDFNTFVDDTNELVQIFDLEYKPSEVLFSIDYEAYVENLGAFRNPEPVEPVSEAEFAKAVEALKAASEPPVAEAVEAVAPAEPVSAPDVVKPEDSQEPSA